MRKKIEPEREASARTLVARGNVKRGVRSAGKQGRGSSKSPTGKIRADTSGKAKPAAPAYAKAVAIEDDATSEDAFRAIGMSCLRQVAANDAAVRALGSEGVHQMRVGLRRLRAAISIFSDLVDGKDTTKIKHELIWLTRRLAAARDLDVFIVESVKSLKKMRLEKNDLQALRDSLEARRREAFENARQAVNSPRYRKLIADTHTWLEAGNWTSIQDEAARSRRERPVEALATKTLTRLNKKVTRKAERLEHLDATKRHKLRIAIKKLRYSVEFFASLFRGDKAVKRRGGYKKSLKKLQDGLGKLNDITVHQKLAATLMRDFSQDKTTQKRIERAMDAVLQRQEKQVAPTMRAAAKAASALQEIKPFWR